MTETDEKEFRLWKKINNQMLDEMFAGKLLQTPKKEVKQYFQALAKGWEELPDRYLYAHSTLCNSIGNYFNLLDCDYGFEIPMGDLDSSYRFEIMAQKGEETIIVEVKPKITTQTLGQVLGYMFDVEKKFKKARVFLGTDILNFDYIIDGGEIRDIILDNAQRHGLGIIFTNKDLASLIPAEFLLM